MSSSSLVMALVSVCLMLVSASLAYTDRTLFPKQMVKKYHAGHSFSFIANGAMWGNLFLISWVFHITWAYEHEWEVAWGLSALTLGIVIAVAMYYFVYLEGKFPDSLTGEGSLLREGIESFERNRLERLSPAGVVQVVYFGLAVAHILLFYFHSSPTAEDVIVVGILLGLYSVVANHIPLMLLHRRFHFRWCPDLFAEESSPLLITGVSLALVAIATAVKI